MAKSTTVYNGSSRCSEKDCNHILTPLETMFGHLCQTCRGKYVTRLVSQGMVNT